jgi:hypothetical protein
VEQERGDDQLSVTDLVDHDAADDDPEAEAGEAGATDVTELRAGESEFRHPIRKDAAADYKADTRGQDGHEACQQQASGVWRDASRSCPDAVAHWFSSDLTRVHRQRSGRDVAEGLVKVGESLRAGR